MTRSFWKVGLLPIARRLARRDIARKLPGALVLHHVRTRIFDELARRAVREGADQLVLLGAGADSRPYRIPELRNVRTFELDHPETGAWKQARVRNMLGKLPDYVHYVPIDFGADPIAPSLAKAGFDLRRRTFFLCEGVTMYLRPEAIDGVLSLVAEAGEGSAIAFDYLYAEAIRDPDRFEGGRAHAEFAASRGEPFLFGLPHDSRDRACFLETRGLTLVGSWDDRELGATYPGDGFFMPFVGIAHARVVSQ